MQNKAHILHSMHKEFVQKDTAALFLAAAMEHFGLKDFAGTSSSKRTAVWTSVYPVIVITKPI